MATSRPVPRIRLLQGVDGLTSRVGSRHVLFWGGEVRPKVLGFKFGVKGVASLGKKNSAPKFDASSDPVTKAIEVPTYQPTPAQGSRKDKLRRLMKRALSRLGKNGAS